MNETEKQREGVVDKDYFRFEKVDEFFKKVPCWHVIKKMESYHWEESDRTLSLNLETDDGAKCVMLFQLATGSVFRVRFHPEKTATSDYAKGNTRTIVLDSFKELIEKNETSQFRADITEIVTTGKAVELSFHGTLEDQLIKIQIMYEPFSVEVKKEIFGRNHHEFTIMSTPPDGLHYISAGGFDDYKIVQSVNKPYTAKYVGFGEQGGMDLVKNSTRITYFNYDNMRYRQVYNHGPFEEREPLYHSDPFFIEVNGNTKEKSACGIFIDNPSEVFLEMGYFNSSQYQFGSRYGDMDYYVLTGCSCADIIKSFSNLIGTARLIPRYALGYHQGCYGYESRKDVEDVVNNHRKYHIPLDGVHIDVDLQENYKTFTIDESKFQNPKEMFSELRSKGVKCSTNITPIISNKDSGHYGTYQEGIKNEYFVSDLRFDPDNPDGRTYYKYAAGEEYEYPFVDKENNYNSGRPFIGEVYYGNKGSVELGTSGHYPDFNRKEVRIWWGRQYQYLFDMGLEMVWQDMTTPCLRDSRGDMLSFPSRLLVNNDFIKRLDSKETYEMTPVMRIWNLYSYNLHKATYHGLNNLKGRENKRNFIIGRGCFTGMQRFAGLWTGDNSSNWEFLKINISQVLALGLTGQALSGQDIGGFERENDWEKWADPELLIRWTAMGAFLPWFRNHYIRKGKKLFQEPYEYQFHEGEVDQSLRDMYKSVLPVCRYYIELRYTLLQLFYDAMFENTLNGLPICRAMFLNSDDQALFNDKSDFLNSQFMVREDLLIAPVIERQDYENGFGKRDVYLPAGSSWYQFNNHKAPLQRAVAGGTTISEFDASISSESFHIPYIVPIYVREGAIIPTVELEQYVGERNAEGLPNPITLHIYPGREGGYTMYLDDGVSRSSQPEGDSNYGVDSEAKGEYRETRITHFYKSVHKRQVKVERIHDGYTPKYEDYMLAAILHDPSDEENPIHAIQINKKEINFMKDVSIEQLKNSDKNAWCYEASSHTSYIKLFDNTAVMEIDITYKGGSDNYFNGGDGSLMHPYEIATAEQLDNLSMLTDTNPELYADAHYRIVNDIIADSYFLPIGTNHPFTGTMDGGQYDSSGILAGVQKITLKINSEGNRIGLFGTIGDDQEDNTKVCNLKLDGKVFSTGDDVGAVVGYLYFGVLDNITICNSMVIKGGDAAGGIAGRTFGGTIKNCTNYAEIQSEGRVGGIASYNMGIIEQCCNAGTVKGMESAGGIVGTNYSESYHSSVVRNCLNAGRVVSLNPAFHSSMGGIVGVNYGAAMSNANIGETPCGSNVFGCCGGGAVFDNYYFAVASYDPAAENKDAEEFESGEVAELLNKHSNCWKQGTLEGIVVKYIKSYPVLK